MYKAQLVDKATSRITSYLFLAFSLLCASMPGFAEERLKLSNTNTYLTSLIRLADDQDLYTAFGIQLELTTNDKDEMAIRSLIDKQTDLAVVAGVPFVKHALKHPNLRLITSIGQYDNEIKLAVRRDRGILSPADLRGKRIGTQPGIAFHLFLNKLLEKHGMTQKDITAVFMPADRLPEALANGLIDAMSSHEPHINQVLELAREQVDIISAPGLYIKSYYLVTTNEFLLSERAQYITPLLQALHEAERRIAGQSPEIKALLFSQLEQSDQSEGQLHETQLQLSMDSRLLDSLETITHWLQQTYGGREQTSANFLRFLHTPLLATVKPNY